MGYTYGTYGREEKIRIEVWWVKLKKTSSKTLEKINTEFIEMVWDDTEWIFLSQDGGDWRNLVTTLLELSGGFSSLANNLLASEAEVCSIS
jgi:hypothetical protein